MHGATIKIRRKFKFQKKVVNFLINLAAIDFSKSNVVCSKNKTVSIVL